MQDDDLIEQYIELNPQRPGWGEARLIRFNVPVWALIGYLQTPGADIERVAADYAVPIRAVEAARAYYLRHKDVIEARIAANNAESSEAVYVA